MPIMLDKMVILDHVPDYFPQLTDCPNWLRTANKEGKTQSLSEWTKDKTRRNGNNVYFTLHMNSISSLSMSLTTSIFILFKKWRAKSLTASLQNNQISKLC